MELEAAARELGVHYQTAYRWVRSGALLAVKVGSEYEINKEDVERMIQLQRLGPSVDPGVTPDWDAHCVEFYERLRAGDEISAQWLVARLHAEGAAPLDLCETLISPTLIRMGEEYDAGAASTADVVLAAGICERLIGSMSTPLRGRPRGLAVVASPEGEQHRLPGLMATAALRADRWRVHYLGADIPVADLLGFVRSATPDVVVLSVGAAVEAGAVAREQVLAGCTARVLLGEAGARLSRLRHEVL